MEGEKISQVPSRSRSTLKVVSLIEAVVGSYSLIWAIIQLHSNGWSLLFKGGEPAVIAAGLIILAATTGVGLLVAAAGLIWVRKWPFALHVPLLLFWSFIVVQTVN
jgi:hypothetical protein